MAPQDPGAVGESDAGTAGTGDPVEEVETVAQPGGGGTGAEAPGDVGAPLGLNGGLRSFLPLLVVAGLVAGVVLWTLLPIGPSAGTVAVIPVEGGINGPMAEDYSGAVERTLSDPTVEAVVLRVSSPGGSATASESMYLRTLALSEELPVVASVDNMAASGSYYTILGSDHIVAKPSSLLGSVGAVFTPPSKSQPTDAVIVSGPSKLGGGSQRGWYYKTKSLQSAFLSAVMRHRSETLTVSRETVATAKLFTGTQAVEAGLADEIGSIRTAADRAASMAGLATYETRVIYPNDTTRFITRSNYVASPASNKTMSSPTYFIGQPATRFPNTLFLPPDLVRTALVRAAGPNETVRVRRVNGSSQPPTGVTDDGG
jgi:protease-4